MNFNFNNCFCLKNDVCSKLIFFEFDHKAKLMIDFDCSSKIAKLIKCIKICIFNYLLECVFVFMNNFISFYFI